MYIHVCYLLFYICQLGEGASYHERPVPGIRASVRSKNHARGVRACSGGSNTQHMVEHPKRIPHMFFRAPVTCSVGRTMLDHLENVQRQGKQENKNINQRCSKILEINKFDNEIEINYNKVCLRTVFE